MASVTQRISMIKQPWGGYIRPSSFETIPYNDNAKLNETENVSGNIIGMTVEYLTKLILGVDFEKAFQTSLAGLHEVSPFVSYESLKPIYDSLTEIKGNDATSIKSACNLVAYDIFGRSPELALYSDGIKKIDPDFDTIENIKVFIDRSISFFQIYGPVSQYGFGFLPPNCSEKDVSKWMKKRKGNLGGYTPVVDSGDGDFLTEDTLWDFKVTKSKIMSKHTLQLLMYWIMGKHSGQPIYSNINRIGIFNPRSNIVYIMNTNDISPDIIKAVETDVICY